MMTKIKLSSKMHLFIIISCIIIVAGMAVGTICHFISNGFFDYGSEFSSYKSITINYLSAEQTEEEVKTICKDAIGNVSYYNVSYADESNGGEVVYKFTTDTDSQTLTTIVNNINNKLSANGGLSSAVLHEAKTYVGGMRVLIYAAIALASAAVAQFIYYLFRYKVSGAFSALLANVHNLGIYVALLAITRVPVGIEAVAFGAVVVLVTMIASGIYLDRVRKNLKEVKYEKTEQSEIADISYAEGAQTISVKLLCMEISVLVLAIFAIIATAHYTILSPYIIALIALVSCAYGCLFFTPSVHPAILKTTTKLALSRKKKSTK
jgi:preprotein translocase subunit SecF